jgi:hypothetical protein
MNTENDGEKEKEEKEEETEEAKGSVHLWFAHHARDAAVHWHGQGNVLEGRAARHRVRVILVVYTQVRVALGG